MLEALGNIIIRFIEKELIAAAPELEKFILDQLTGFIDMIAGYLTGKGQTLAALPKPESEE